MQLPSARIKTAPRLNRSAASAVITKNSGLPLIMFVMPTAALRNAFTRKTISQMSIRAK